jgi:hypothetical protein
MAGGWSIHGIANWEKLWMDGKPSHGLVPSRIGPDGQEQSLDGITTMLLMALPIVDMEEISEENVTEVFVRIRMLELASGPMITGSDKPSYISLASLRRRIGLRVGWGIPLTSFESTLVNGLRKRAKEALETEQSKTVTG